MVRGLLLLAASVNPVLYDACMTLCSVYSTVRMSDCSVVLCVYSRRRFIWCVSRGCNGSGNYFHCRLVQRLKLFGHHSRITLRLPITCLALTDVLKCLYLIRLVMNTHPITPPLQPLSLTPYPTVTVSDLVWMQLYSKWVPFLLCFVWC